MLSFMVGIGLLLSNSIALPLQQHHANLDSNYINSNSNLDNASNYQTSYDTSLLSSGTNAGYLSAKPFSFGGNGTGTFAYRDNGFIMASGYNGFGQLGNTTTKDVGESFALYKEGDESQPFYNVIDYSFANASTVIDSAGMLWTAGNGYYGRLGNGYSHSSYTDQDGNPGVTGWLGDYGSSYNQYSFQQVLTAKDVLDANKANALPDDYKAVSTSISYHSLVLLDDGTLYGAGYQNYIGLGTTTTAQTHFTRLDGRATGLPQASASNKIKDFSVGGSSVWVLYENGELYMTASTATNGATIGEYTLVASDIKFFDVFGYSSRVYAVNTSNQILSCTQDSSTLTTLVATPNGTVTQVRSSNGGGWGYLNSNNELYLSTTTTNGEINVPGASNNTQTGTTFYKMDNVAFFDLGGTASKMTYGVMYTNGSMTVWGDNSYGQLGNGSVGSGGNITTPDQGIKPDIEFDEVPDVESEDGSSKPTITMPNPPAIFLKKM